jgi:cephalosporin-C deacetylase-like acetyl esterase
VQWRDGDPIDLYIVRPEGVAKPPVVLYLYGYPGEAVRFLNQSLCATVTKNGYAAVGFSSMLTGQRYHDVPMKEWFVSDLQHSLVGTTHDVQMVLNYLADRGDFDMTRVGVFGDGSGATIAVLAASADSRIKAVDLLNPWGDWPAWMQSSLLVPNAERPDYLRAEFLASIGPLDPIAVLPKLTTLPIRLQQNLWDTTKTPPAARQRIAAATPPNAQLVQYRDESEYFDKVGSKGKMLDWMYAHLRPNK